MCMQCAENNTKKKEIACTIFKIKTQIHIKQIKLQLVGRKHQVHFLIKQNILEIFGASR